MARKSRVKMQEVPEMVEESPVLAGSYNRLSVEDGDDVEQNSIGNQKKLALHYIGEHPDIQLVDTYSDHGYTGMNYNRPEFQRMLRDLQSGRINCIIVKDISRLGRHFVMTSELVERIFPEMGVRLISINDGYDSVDEFADVSALTMPLKMVMNDYYVKDISQKIRSSISAKMESGQYLPAAGSVPYGYLRNPEAMTFDIDPEAAPVVRQIYEMRAAGISFNHIAQELNTAEIPCPGKLRYLRGITKAQKYENALWIRGTIRKITGDQVYIGNRVHGKVKRDKVGQRKKRRAEQDWKVIENAHPAIVSETLFQQVQQVNQEELAKRTHFEERAGFETDYRDLFRGKVFCAECGSSMGSAKGCARPDAKTPSRIFFDCNNYRYSAHTRCSSHYVRQELLMEKVVNLLNQQLKLAVDVDQLAEDIKKRPEVVTYQSDAESKYASVSAKRRNMEMKLEQLLEDLANRLIDRSEYDYMKERYSRQLEELLAEENAALEAKQAMECAVQSAKKWISTIREYEKFPNITRELLDYLVDRIDVFGDRRIKITLNYADPFQPLTTFLNRIEVMQDAV